MSKNRASNRADSEAVTETTFASMSGDLWELCAKLHGIAELIKSQNSEPFGHEDANFGIGQLVTDIANDLKEIRERLELKMSREDCESDPIPTS